MTVVKLSFAIMMIHWCNKAVDWFMLFFEDSELYWTEDKEKKTTFDAYSKSLKPPESEKSSELYDNRVRLKTLLKSKINNTNNSSQSKQNSTLITRLKPNFQFRSISETLSNMFD